MVIGDSRSAYYGAADGNAWVDSVARAHTLITAPYSGHPWTSVLAYSGWTTTDVKNNVGGYIAEMTQEPGFVLMNVGINDVNASVAQATITANLNAIIDSVHAHFPSASIYLAKIWHRGAVSVATFNLAVDSIVSARSYVYAGHDETDWMEGGDNGVTMTVDGLHYSTAGQLALGALWNSILPSGPFSDTTTTPPAVVPTDIPGLVLWLDASDITTTFKDSTRTRTATANNDTVKGWTFKYPAGNYAKCGTVQRFITNAQNSRPGISITGAGGMNLNSVVNIPLNGEFYAVAVVHRRTNASIVTPFGSASVYGDAFTQFNDDKYYWIANSGSVSTAANNVSGTQIMGVIRLNDKEVSFYYNGSEFSHNTSTNKNDAWGIGKIGERLDADAITDDYLFELLIYSGTLTAGNLTSLHNYLNAKWAVY